MYQALYRKWRPKTFSDVVGQKNITATLENEVESGNLSHAYLLTGSRGTGKTTCAKILAKAVNCLNPVHGNPCNECEICKGVDNGSITDVVEIDAASNNGVDNIRALIDETNFSPVKAKKRVYIIDEVHMLSTAACNAFLKTLEEPLPHVIFILATTDPQKLLPTVRSRCQRFDFKRISPEDIAGRLIFVAGQEGLTLENDAAVLLARIADGALRDALSLLDVCSVKSRDISVKVVSEVAGLADKGYLFALTDCIKSGSSGNALELIQELHSNSCEMELLSSELMNHLRSLMIIKTVKSNKKAAELLVCTDADFELLKQQAELFTLNEIVNSLLLLEETAGNINKGVNKRVELEIAVIRLCSRKQTEAGLSGGNGHSAIEKPVAEPPQKQPAKETPVEQITSAPAFKEDPPVSLPFPAQEELAASPAAFEPEDPAFSAENNYFESIDAENITASLEEETVDNDAPEDTAEVSAEQPGEDEKPFTFWPDVLRELYDKDPSLWGFLSNTSAFIDDNNLFIHTAHKSALEMYLETGEHKGFLNRCVLDVGGKSFRIVICEKTLSSGGKNEKLKGFMNKVNGLNS